MKNFKDIANQFNSIDMVRAKGKKVIVRGLNSSDEPFQLEVDYTLVVRKPRVQASLF